MLTRTGFQEPPTHLQHACRRPRHARRREWLPIQEVVEAGRWRCEPARVVRQHFSSGSEPQGHCLATPAHRAPHLTATFRVYPFRAFSLAATTFREVDEFP